VVRLVTHQPLATILFPFRLLVAPLFADSTAHWLAAILPAFALMMVHYPWVTHTDAAFEEAVADAAAKRARAGAASRHRRPHPVVIAEGAVPRPWFKLSPAGHPAIAIIWKNVLAFTRALRLTTLSILLGTLLFIAIAVYTEVGDWSDLAQIGETLCVIPIVMLVVLGPGIVRADLRQDLLQLDQLRSYPLRGSMIVAAEIASSAIILSVMQYLLLALAAVLSSFGAQPPVPVLPAVLIALVMLPMLNAIALTVANGSALLFPGWVRLGDGRAAGVEAMGQNVLAVFVSLVITFLALIPPLFVTTLVASGLSAVASHRIGVWDFVLAVPEGALVVVGELWLTIKWLGRVFARTDLAQIEPPE